MINGIDLNSIEENTLLVLYYLYMKYPKQPKKNAIVDTTGLSGNTVSSKLKTLKDDLKLVKSRRSGRSVQYFVDENVKKYLDEWIKTDMGKATSEKFNDKIDTGLD